MAKCTAHSSQTGNPCRNNAIDGGTVCRMHGGSAPQVKQAALERIRAAAFDAAGELARLAVGAESEAVRVSAIKDLLDRAGLNAKQIIESDVTVHDGSEVDREIARLTAELAGRATGRSPGGTEVADNSTT